MNLDTLQYRLHSCKNNNYTLLDLSNLELFYIPDITNHYDYKNIKNIEYLFVNNNNISIIQKDELEQFTNIIVLDVSSNNLTNLNYLPNTLIELVCKNNYIINICKLSNLIKLDCSFNNMSFINNYEKLEILDCSNTNISIIYLKKLKKLYCNNSKICDIQNCHNIEIIEMINSKIEKLFYFSNLKKIVFSIDDKFFISNKYKLKDKQIDNDNVITILL